MDNLRCEWVLADDPLYIRYHDEEWGVPLYDSRALFEKLILDGFQAGLSWRTILHKRDNFIQAFEGFEPEKIAAYGDTEIEKLLQNEGIIRSAAKIKATIGNARAWLKMQEEQEFSDYLWDYVGGKPILNQYEKMSDLPAKTEISEKLSKNLKKRGFKFCGPVIVYAFMQAVGMVNDHELSCPRYQACKALA